MTAREKRLAYEAEQRRYNFLRMWKKRYYHMKSRAEGRATNASHAQGKDLMTLEEFMEWCKLPENLMLFIGMWYEFAEADFPLWLSPSVDRIDPNLGYTADNIQWMTFSENCEKNHKDPITHKMLKEEYA